MSNCTSWHEDITLDMIPLQYLDLVQAMGIKPFLALTQVAGGSNLYVPKEDYFYRIIRDRCIYKDFNGHNMNTLCKKFKLSRRQLEKILKEQERK